MNELGAVVTGSGAVACLTNPIEVFKTRRLLSEPKLVNRFPNGIKQWANGLQPSICYHMISSGLAVHTLRILDIIGVDKPKRNKPFNYVQSLKLASILGVPSAILPSPLHLVKVRFHSNALDGVRTGYQHLTYGGTIGLLRNVFETELGPIALYRAALSNYARYVAMNSIALYAYVKLQNNLSFNTDLDKNRVSVISAVTGGVIGAFIASPLDLISTRLYNQGISRYGGNMEYTGFKHCISRLIFTEGISAFYKHSLSTTLPHSIHISVMLYLWNRYNLICD